MSRPWPQAGDSSLLTKVSRAKRVPRVELVVSHAGAGAALVDALVTQGVDGIVVAGTGNGSVHHEMEKALLAAQGSGVKVLRSTRCPQGRVLAHPADRLPASPDSPVKARIALMLELLA